VNCWGVMRCSERIWALNFDAVIVYLDQNKWIELAKIVHGKDKSPRAIKILYELGAAIDSGCVLPLSAIHYMELARVSNVARKARLGSVMWEYSKGITLVPYSNVVRFEIENALSKYFPQVIPNELKLLGSGISHAFGVDATSNFPPEIEAEIERSMLTGSAVLNIDPLAFRSNEHRVNFSTHLGLLHTTKNELPKSKWENWLYGIALADIRKPLAEVMTRFGIEKSVFETLGEAQLKAIVDEMPSRKLDMHLHRQVLRNPNYISKETDLEDWAGLGVASCYCDVVVCEKHMADMIQRDHFSAKARIETNIADIFPALV